MNIVTSNQREKVMVQSSEDMPRHCEGASRPRNDEVLHFMITELLREEG